jgi:hypothetical protein
MPGLVPGIHVLAAYLQENHFQVVRKKLKMLTAFSVRLSG